MFSRNFPDRDPWNEMGRIQHEMNRLFNRASSRETDVYPAINIWANSDAIIVTSELPGYDSKEIQLSIMNNQLTISGNRKQENIKDSYNYHRQERPNGNFQRSITLPFAVESGKIEATYTNGILTVTLPRAEADKPKKINIKTK